MPTRCPTAPVAILLPVRGGAIAIRLLPFPGRLNPTPFAGLVPPLYDGLFADGLNPPPDGRKPPPEGREPPFDGLNPPPDGRELLLDGVNDGRGALLLLPEELP